MRGASPSGGMLKRMFDPTNAKKKEKAALGYAKSGGPNIQKEKPRFTKKK
jgi:hypothetical protein